MNMSYKGFLAVGVLAMVLALSACKQEGPAEKAGQNVEQAGKTTTPGLSDKSKTSGEIIDDAAITAEVKAEIAKDPMLKMSQITVTTTKGVVRLSGSVDSQQNIDRALEITKKVKNIQGTENNLVVKSTN